jgi:hypothetical protein
MGKNTFVKISLTIFVFLSLIISLFPPFEFGRAYSVNARKGTMFDRLPIKQYDFIFNSNRKNFALFGEGGLCCRRFKKGDSTEKLLEYYKDRWPYPKVEYVYSVDSFFTAERVLFRDTTKQKFYFDESADSQIEERINQIDVPAKGYKLESILELGEWGEAQNKYVYHEINGKNIIKYYLPETNKDAINYNEILSEYNKIPNDWSYKYVLKFDSSGKYLVYKLTEPMIYLLDRDLLLSELLVEYILALFVSIIGGYLIQRFVFRKDKTTPSKNGLRTS